jgi:hypothetical protein
MMVPIWVSISLTEKDIKFLVYFYLNYMKILNQDMIENNIFTKNLSQKINLHYMIY